MSLHRKTTVKTATYVPEYVTVSESFEKKSVWQHWGKLDAVLIQQLRDQLLGLGWKDKIAGKPILVKNFISGSLTVSAEIDLDTREVALKGNFSKTVEVSGAGKARKRGRKEIERMVLECEITALQEMNRAFDALKIDISAFDYFNLRVEWQSIVGENPGDFLPRLLRQSGWQEESGETRVFAKNVGREPGGCQLRMDLDRMEAVIRIAREKNVFLKDETREKKQLQNQLFDEIEEMKDNAMLELNRLKQQVYKEALMEYARSRGDVEVTIGETGDEFHMVIEVTRGVQA